VHCAAESDGNLGSVKQCVQTIRTGYRLSGIAHRRCRCRRTWLNCDYQRRITLWLRTRSLTRLLREYLNLETCVVRIPVNSLNALENHH